MTVIIMAISDIFYQRAIIAYFISSKCVLLKLRSICV